MKDRGRDLVLVEHDLFALGRRVMGAIFLFAAVSIGSGAGSMSFADGGAIVGLKRWALLAALALAGTCALLAMQRLSVDRSQRAIEKSVGLIVPMLRRRYRLSEYRKIRVEHRRLRSGERRRRTWRSGYAVVLVGPLLTINVTLWTYRGERSATRLAKRLAELTGLPYERGLLGSLVDMVSD